jgi:UDP-glucose 4-epimerase
MKYLITGGAGFIGSNLARLLVQRGHSVIVLDDLSTGHLSNLDFLPDGSLIRGDIRDPDVLDSAMAEVEVVFHLAASVGNARSILDPVADAEVNVLGTIQVLEAMRRNRVSKIVSSSSAGVFGELRTLPIREDHPIEPDSPYGATKLCSEKLVLAYGRMYGVHSVCLRYFNVYGINQRFDPYGNVIPIFTQRMLSGEPVTLFGDGEQTRDFIHVSDIAQANLAAAAPQVTSGAYNLGSGTATSILELARLMGGLLGMEPRFIHAPARKGDVRHSRSDISAATRHMGWHPVMGLREGLDSYLRWVQSQSGPCSVSERGGS